MKEEWLIQAEACIKEHQSMLLLLGEDSCVQCLRTMPISNLLILDLQIEGRDVPEHSTLATFCCSTCHKSLNQVQIVKNINYYLTEFNAYVV